MHYDPEDAAFQMWCRRHWALLREGGMWAVPRSGLIFERRGGKLVLTAAMPWSEDMAGVITAEQLREQQDAEFASIRAHFAAVGVDVERAEPVAG